MINLIICGAPGSGKGTQSSLIIEKYKLNHISTGDLLRKEIADGTELGKFAQTLIADGQLVPDETIIGIIANKIDELNKGENNGVVFDGFPRTIAQAEALEKLLTDRGMKTDLLLDLDVEEQELIERLLNRGKTSGRSDDNLETIQKRLNVYYSQTKPIAEFYKKLDKYKNIHGMGTIDDIFGRISDAIDSIK